MPTGYTIQACHDVTKYLSELTESVASSAELVCTSLQHQQMTMCRATPQQDKSNETHTGYTIQACHDIVKCLSDLSESVASSAELVCISLQHQQMTMCRATPQVDKSNETHTGYTIQ